MRLVGPGAVVARAVLFLFAGAVPVFAQEIRNWSAPPFWQLPDKAPKSAESSAGPAEAEGAGSSPMPFVAIQPCRLVDTRNAPGSYGGPALGGNAAPRAFNVVTGPCPGISTSAAAYSLNVAAILPAADGFLTVFPTGSDQPNTSDLNFLAGEVLSNAIIAVEGASNSISVFTNVTTHALIDINGFYLAGGLDSIYVNEGQIGSVLSSMIVDGIITNVDISASAAIADHKLATISSAGKVADSALSANVSKLGESIEAGEITDFERSINLPLSEFFDCESGGGFIDFTSGADNRADLAFTSVNSVQLLFDAVLGQEDQGTRVCTSFPLPLDYVSGGRLVVGLVKGSENSGPAERITCTFGFEIAAPVTPGNNTIGSATFIPDYYGCAPPVLPANMFALRSLRVYLSITTASGTMNDAIGIRNISFIYTAKQ